MTAVDVDALDKLREALAEALAEIHDDESRPNWTWLADALLPVVDRIATERAAAALRAAADEVKSWHRVYGYASGQLRARAAALREPTP